MPVDYLELKKGGFIQQKQKGRYLMRLRSRTGNLTAEDLRNISALAEKYGRGYIHLTARQGVEIPWVKLDDFDSLQADLRRTGLLAGACGPRVRSIMVCPGEEICVHGLMPARQTAEDIDRLFFGRELPVKLKIAVSGCPNSCVKPQENDLGLYGVVDPEHNSDLCTGCGICAEACPAGAIKLVGDLPVLDRSRCLHEGNCIASCPVDAWRPKRQGYHLLAGGKVGKFPRQGERVAEFVPPGQVVAALEAGLRLFLAEARPGERVGDVIGRLGAGEFSRRLRLELAPVQDGCGRFPDSKVAGG